MQTINRNNYEEFFLLYIDNELGVEHKIAVESFVQQNPDLAVEFNMLMQTKSHTDETIFSDKENLLRTEGTSINETNYEEYFLLYIDNELSAAKLEEVEMYVLQHPKLQDEFTILKQTVLTPETINYYDKENLYQTERKRIAYLKPLRLAAAAIFIGVCAVGFWMMQKTSSTNTVATASSAHKKAQQNTAIIKPVDSIKQNIQSTEKDIAQQETVSHQSLPKKENKKIVEIAITKKKEPLKQVVAETKNNNEQKIINEQPVITRNNVAVQQKEPPSTIDKIAQESPRLDENRNQAGSLQTMPDNNQNETGYAIYPVAYKELNTDDENRSLHVGMFDLNKEKVKTFFKKASRMLTNKSDNNNNTN